ncbi:hypothetical protein [Kordia sp.]|uniref:hypothetical protein n=1 Tax=Kordia sp. TaxID=1965332 RepID=UPI003D2D0A40
MSALINWKIIPLVISIILVVSSTVITFFTNYILSTKLYLGFALVLLATILYATNQKWFAFFFFLVLLIGTVGLIDIFYIEFSFKRIFIKINPLCFSLLFMHVLLNKTSFNDILSKKDVNKKK